MTTYASDKYNIKITQGNDWNFEFQLVTQDSLGVETPINVTGYVINGVVKNTRTSAVAQTMAYTIVDAALGKLKVTLTDTQTSTLTLGSLYYQIDRTVANDTLTLFSGNFIVK